MLAASAEMRWGLPVKVVLTLNMYASVQYRMKGRMDSGYCHYKAPRILTSKFHFAPSLFAPKFSTDHASSAPHPRQTPAEQTERHTIIQKLARRYKIWSYFVLGFTIKCKLVWRLPSGYFVDSEPVHSGLRRMKFVTISLLGHTPRQFWDKLLS